MPVQAVEALCYDYQLDVSRYCRKIGHPYAGRSAGVAQNMYLIVYRPWTRTMYLRPEQSGNVQLHRFIRSSSTPPEPTFPLG